MFFFFFFFFFFFLFLALVAIFVQRAEQFCNFGNGSPKKHFCEIILKSGHLPRRRCRLEVSVFLALVAILFSGVEPFEQFR